MSPKRGVPEDKLATLERWADEQFAELRRHFSDREIVELTAQAAFENFRARFDRALRIEDDGFARVPVSELPRTF